MGTIWFKWGIILSVIPRCLFVKNYKTRNLGCCICLGIKQQLKKLEILAIIITTPQLKPSTFNCGDKA